MKKVIEVVQYNCFKKTNNCNDNDLAAYFTKLKGINLRLEIEEQKSAKI